MVDVANAFLDGQATRSGQLTCTAGCSSTALDAHTSAANSYLGASIITQRETSWNVYQVSDGTFSSTYPNVSAPGADQVNLPALLTGDSAVGSTYDSAGHTHWDSNNQFSPQDWSVITGYSKGTKGTGISGTTLFVATPNGNLQYATSSMVFSLGIQIGTRTYPPTDNFDGRTVSNNIHTGFP